MKIIDYLPYIMLATFLVLGAFYVISGSCNGGPKVPHECSTVNSGGGDADCIRACGEGFVATEEYCVHCSDCMMCYYGCDLETILSS